MTLLYSDNKFLLHETGRHPECAARLEAVSAQLKRSGLLSQVTSAQVQRADDVDVLRVHTADHIKAVRDLAEAGGGRVDADTVVSPDSADVAWLAAGTGIDAVTRVVAGDDANALCLVRPPGHQAVPDRAMGFCLFNNAAIAALTALERGFAERVLIVDWDVHHGNGTEAVFYGRDDVLTVSLHQERNYPIDTGDKEDRGKGAGLGYNINVPLPPGAGHATYVWAME